MKADELIQSYINFTEMCLGREIRNLETVKFLFELYLKQIHGLDGCNGSKSKKAISHSSGEGNGK